MGRQDLWVVTAGTTDIQVLARSGDEVVRVPLATRMAHEQLLERVQTSNPGPVGWVHPSRVEDALALGEVPPAELGAQISESTGTLTLFAPKLAALRPDQQAPAGVMVLNTWRDSGSPRSAGEPVAAGPLLALWLQSVSAGERAPTSWQELEFPLEKAMQSSGDADVDFLHRHPFFYLNYLQDQEELKDLESVAAPRLHAALSSCWQSSRFNGVVIADTGGPAGFKEAIRLCAALVFGDDQILAGRAEERTGRRRPGTGEKHAPLRVLEDGQWQVPKSPPADGVAPAFDPVKSIDQTLEHRLRTRLAVVELLCRGAFDAAAGLSRTAATGPQGWAEVVDCAASIIGRGWRVPPEGQEDYAPPVREMLPSMVAAFRVEAALCRGAFAEAITRTFEFQEWATIALIRQGLQKRLHAAGLLAESDQIEILGDLTIQGLNIDSALKFTALKRALTCKDMSRVKGIGVDRVTPRGETREITLLRIDDDWQRGLSASVWLGMVQHADLVSWRFLDEAVFDRFVLPFDACLSDGSDSPRSYRNAQSHNGLVDDPLGSRELAASREAFVASKAWSPSARGSDDERRKGRGTMFLESPLVRGLLRSVYLDETLEPSSIFREWIENLVSYVRHSPL